ncbi:hypothetical protein ACFL02_09095 [Planctomycetota bacterium]
MKKQDLDKVPQLLDYLLNLDAPDQHRQTEQLIAQNENIRQLYDILRQNLALLDNWRDETAPESLAEGTLKYVEEQEKARKWASAPADFVAHRIEQEVPKDAISYGSRSRWVLHNLRDIIAVAASIMLVMGLLHPAFRNARLRSQQLACANQLGRIGFASNNYASDNNGYLPRLPRQPGDKWWSVGQQGSNSSNTYLLVRQGYLPAQVFLCPGVDNKSVQLRLQINPQQLKTMHDFPGRGYVNYSFRLIVSSQPLTRDNINNVLPIVSDQNPIFARFNSEKSTELDLTQNKTLLMSNSPNHANRGQNLLFPDGSVRFVTDRLYQSGPDRDDIFTIRAIFRYSGTEMPKSDRDIFIH